MILMSDVWCKTPNILFMMTDQHRFDVLGAWGNKGAKTPSLDRYVWGMVWIGVNGVWLMVYGV